MLLLSPGGSRVCFAWSTQGILSAIWLQYNLKRTSASSSCAASDHCQERGTSEMCAPGTRKILFESLLRMTSRRKATYAKKKMDCLRICHKQRWLRLYPQRIFHRTWRILVYMHIFSKASVPIFWKLYIMNIRVLGLRKMIYSNRLTCLDGPPGGVLPYIRDIGICRP